MNDKIKRIVCNDFAIKGDCITVNDFILKGACQSFLLELVKKTGDKLLTGMTRSEIVISIVEGLYNQNQKSDIVWFDDNFPEKQSDYLYHNINYIHSLSSSSINSFLNNHIIYAKIDNKNYKILKMGDEWKTQKLYFTNNIRFCNSSF